MRPWLPFLLLGLATMPTSAQTLTKQLESEPIRQLADDARRFGDSRRGAIAFYQPTMNCARCHESSKDGRRLGPDLSEQREIKLDQLVQSILNPSAEIKTGFETALFQLGDGRQLQGILVRQTDSHFLVDRIEQPNEPLQIDREDVEDWKQTKLSSMPDGLANQLADRQQFLDLISYLAEIATNGPERASELKPAGAMSVIPLPAYEAHIDHAALIRSLDDESFELGSETYRLRCQSCHGTINEEGFDADFVAICGWRIQARQRSVPHVPNADTWIRHDESAAVDGAPTKIRSDSLPPRTLPEEAKSRSVFCGYRSVPGRFACWEILGVLNRWKIVPGRR